MNISSALLLFALTACSILSSEARAASVKVDDNDPAIVYSGNWSAEKDPKAYGGGYRATSDAGATATFKFTGTSIRWIGKLSNEMGQADLYIDDVSQGVIDGADPVGEFQRVVFEKIGLSDGPHTLKIESNGIITSGRSGARIIVDALEYNFSSQGFVDSGSPAITFSGSWNKASDANAYHGSYKYTTAPNASAEYTFTGGSTKWIATQNKDRGLADVYIDDVFDTRVNLYRAEPASKAVVYEKYGLTYGLHKIRISCTGMKGMGATDCIVDLNALEYNACVNSVEDNGNTNIVYSGPWTRTEDANAYNENVQSSSTPNASAEFWFSGRSISWLATLGKDKGKADVYIDDKFQANVDLYNASTQWQKTAFEKTGLSDAMHVIKIICKGDKNPSSTGNDIDLDAFGVNLKPLTKVDDLYAGVSYSGTWNRGLSQIDYAGTLANTAQPGATAQLDFTGTTLRIAGGTNNAMGLADVFIDGVQQQPADFYSEMPLTRKIVFDKTGLAPGKHTVKIVCRTDKNPSSSGVGMYLDYFEVDHASTLYADTGAEDRHLVFGEWNWPIPTSLTLKQFKANASFARQIGFNVIRIHIPWSVAQTGADTYDYSLYDNELDYVVNILGMKAAMVLDLTVRADKPMPLNLDEMQNDGTLYGMLGRAPFSWSSPTGVAKASDFLGRVVGRYHGRYPTGSILYCTAAFAQYIESEGWDRWSDTSKCSVDAFRKFCQDKFGTIAALNANWGSSYASFNDIQAPTKYDGNNGLAWYQFKHSKLKALLENFGDTVAKASEGSIKFAPQFGSVWDSYTRDRTTFAFPDLVASNNIQMLITDDAPDYNHLWTLDLMRGSLPGKWISEETDGPWNGHNEVSYEIQTAQAFMFGANVVSMANWDNQIYRFKSAAWIAVEASASFLPYKVPTSYPSLKTLDVSAYAMFRTDVGAGMNPWKDVSQNGASWVNVKLKDDLSQVTPPPAPK